MTEQYAKDSKFAYQRTKENYHDSAANRWSEKEIKDRLVIDKQLAAVKLHGIGEVRLVHDFSHQGDDSIKLTTNTDIADIRPRPHSKLLISLKNYNLKKYNRISVWVYPKAIGFQNFYFHFTLYLANGKLITHIDSLTPNQWNLVTWEMPDNSFEELNQIGMGPVLLGCPPEAEPQLEVYIDELEFQLVDADYDLGWELDERIAFCHSGYFIDAEKIALTQNLINPTFFLFNEQEEVVYKGNAKKIATEIGSYYQLDFTDFTKEGNYYLGCDNRKTGLFTISKEPYERSIWKSINFLRMLRCGDDVEGVHSPCHLNSYTTASDGRMVPNFGGWHDAGDVSQFEICTAEIAHSLLDLAERIQKSNPQLNERLLVEARYGLNWLLRTSFGNGERALAVHYSIWHKNILKDINQINPVSKLQNVSENGAYENFLAASALAVAARLYPHDEVFANWCLRVAVEDFNFGVEGHQKGLFSKRWGVVPEPQIGGAAALAAAELYVITGDDKYLEVGAEFALKILESQQSTLPAWEKPLRGFFYEDSTHTHLLTYEHRGHEQDPIQGLARLLEVAPNHTEAPKWKKGLELYAEYIQKTSDVCSPFNMLPAQVYDVTKINIDRFTIPSSYGTKEEGLLNLQSQIQTGIKLDDNIYLRRFPIAVQRRGYHATLLSKTKAVSIIARLLNNKSLRQVAINQLEWILGKNPFASSTMYGEGYNYHPLYVAFSPQIVGALPVGIKTKDEHDAPYWPVLNNAVYKEIWGHTTCKYLWVLADLL